MAPEVETRSTDEPVPIPVVIPAPSVIVVPCSERVPPMSEMVAPVESAPAAVMLTGEPAVVVTVPSVRAVEP